MPVGECGLNANLWEVHARNTPLLVQISTRRGGSVREFHHQAMLHCRLVEFFQHGCEAILLAKSD
jgi:hypothetical protein